MRLWATNDVYGSGHGNLTGKANKADPGRANAGNGFVPGWLPAQHINHQMAEISQYANIAQVRGGAQREALTNTTTAFGAAVAWMYDLEAVVLIDDTNLSWVGSNTQALNVATVSVLHDVNAAAADRPSGRLVTVGSNTNKARFSDNNGASFTTATTAPAANLDDVVSLARDADGGGDFVAVPTTPAANVYLTTDNGVNWSTVATTRSTAGGVARIDGASSAGIVASDLAGRYETTELAASTYTTWTDRGQLPDFGNITLSGNVAGAPDYSAYWVGEYTDEIRLYRLAQTDGAWELVSSFSHTGASGLQLLVDLPTGSIFVVAYGSPTTYVYSSHNGGYSWQGPYSENVVYADRKSVRAAGGRLYHRVGSSWYRTAVPSPRDAV